MYELDWEAGYDPYYGGRIHIPKGLIMYRGYETNNVPILERPCYYGSKLTAQGYAKLPNRKLGTFCTTKDLFVLDIRLVCVLLKQLFENNNGESYTKEEEKCILAATISFGLSSLSHQNKLIKYAYKNKFDTDPGFIKMNKLVNPKAIIEQAGIRFAETFVDGKTIAFLKELLHDVCDGIISPRLYSPFLYDKNDTNSPELIIFNSQRSQVKMVQLTQQTYPIMTMNQMILKHQTLITIGSPLHISTSMFMNGGNSKKQGKTTAIIAPFEEFNTLLTINDPEACKVYKLGERVGKKWRNTRTNIIQIEVPKPTVPSLLFGGNTLDM